MGHENNVSDSSSSNSYHSSSDHQSTFIETNLKQPVDTLAGNCGDRYLTQKRTASQQAASIEPARGSQQTYSKPILVEPSWPSPPEAANHQHGQHAAAYAIATGRQHIPPAATATTVLFDYPYHHIQHHYSSLSAAHLATQPPQQQPILVIASAPTSNLQLAPMAMVTHLPVAGYYAQPVLGPPYHYSEQHVYPQPTPARPHQLTMIPPPVTAVYPNQQALYSNEPQLVMSYTDQVALSTKSHLAAYLSPQSVVYPQQAAASVLQHLQHTQATGYIPVILIDADQQQQQQATLTSSIERQHQIADPLIAFSQLKAGYNLISALPIDAQLACTRQAYGMDKVWHDEFEQLFSQLISSIVWTLIEVESNPSLRNSGNIIDYRGRYIVKVDSKERENRCLAAENRVAEDEEEEEAVDRVTCSDVEDGTNGAEEDSDEAENSSDENEHIRQPTAETDRLALAGNELESDCDSGAQVDSTSCGSDTCNESSSSKIEPTNTSAINGKDCSNSDDSATSLRASPTEQSRSFPTKFRMFIDSAKVRFCCDNCGHGWTSMKGRVVFWYELFELVDSSEPTGNGENNLIGYCAYKLFGQQCDICKIENRFERPMWYPEEVTKVLNNLYNKIGQVYFGFKMPAIDKQRRAGKPKTSHNSSLCQACKDGVCTDRK